MDPFNLDYVSAGGLRAGGHF